MWSGHFSSNDTNIRPECNGHPFGSMSFSSLGDFHTNVMLSSTFFCRNPDHKWQACTFGGDVSHFKKTVAVRFYKFTECSHVLLMFTLIQYIAGTFGSGPTSLDRLACALATLLRCHIGGSCETAFSAAFTPQLDGGWIFFRSGAHWHCPIIRKRLRIDK